MNEVSDGTSVNKSNEDENVTACSTCASILFDHLEPRFMVDRWINNKNNADCLCMVCSGMWLNGKLSQRILSDIEHRLGTALKPYLSQESGIKISLSKLAPSISLPLDLAIRSFSFIELVTKESQLESNTLSPQSLAMKYIQKSKDMLRNELREHLKVKYNAEFCAGDGILDVHIAINVFQPCLFSGRFPSSVFGLSETKRLRKRYRGSHGLKCQGGDPRVNLEKRNQNKQPNISYTKVLQSISALSKEEKTNILQWIKSQPLIEPQNFKLSGVTCSAAVWRRPFYLFGRYTKKRRDVSQTPFFVVEAGKCKRLGVTSVEEQICPSVSEACGGISELNNSNDGDTIFGFVKFHASGREDMDVLMSASNGKRSGRPFVCEVIDAFRKPNQHDLSLAVHKINAMNEGELILSRNLVDSQRLCHHIMPCTYPQAMK